MDTLSILLISLVVLLLFGVPVYMVLISSTMISLFAFSSLPLTVIHNALFEGLNSFPLLAIPCFVVAGTLMEQGGVTGQIIDVVKMLVGRMYGGLGSRRSWPAPSSPPSRVRGRGRSRLWERC